MSKYLAIPKKELVPIDQSCLRMHRIHSGTEMPVFSRSPKEKGIQPLTISNSLYTTTTPEGKVEIYTLTFRLSTDS